MSNVKALRCDMPWLRSKSHHDAVGDSSSDTAVREMLRSHKDVLLALAHMLPLDPHTGCRETSHAAPSAPTRNSRWHDGPSCEPQEGATRDAGSVEV